MIAYADEVSRSALMAKRSEADPAFMLVAGISAPEEMCLLEAEGKVYLDSCLSAVAAGDGRELWSLEAGGQLMHVVSKKCAGSSGGASIAMTECSGASVWKILANGQAQVGDKCLSQSGVAVGTENVALWAATTATSWTNSASHGSVAAVDADDATFWASKPNEASPVAFTVDLGETREISLLKIIWEFPAESFAVASLVDGQHWTEVFSTTVNMVNVTQLPLGQTVASKVRVTMRKPHPVYGKFSGQSVYGIKSLAILAPRLQVTLDDCTVVAQSKDARDKYFASAVSNFDPASSAALRAEVPALNAAKASLSAALSEVATMHQKLPGCQNQGVGLKSHLKVLPMDTSSLSSGKSGKSEGFTVDMPAEVVGLVDSMHGIDVADIKMLLASAKSTIVRIRDELR